MSAFGTRWLLPGLVLTGTAAPLALAAVRPSPRPAAPAAFAQQVRPLLSQYCFSCHNAKTQSAGFDLDALSSAPSAAAHRAEWQKVLEKIQTGAMPPKGSPQPTPTSAQALVRAVTQELGRAASQPAQAGRVTARRLNRAEYNNTLRDLLGVDLRPADDFPQDDSGYGFDNIGDVLSLSPVLMERYLGAAEEVTRAALYGPRPMKPMLARVLSPRRKIPPVMKAPHEYDETGLSLAGAAHGTYRCPADGQYHFRIITGGVRPNGSEPLHIALWVDGKQVKELELDPEGKAGFFTDRQDLFAKAVECRIPLTAGDHWIEASYLKAYEGLPVAFEGPNPSKRMPRDPTLATNNTPEAKPAGVKPPGVRPPRKKDPTTIRPEPVPANGAYLASVEISGPFEQVKGAPEQSLRKIFTCGHLHGGHTASCARKVIGDFARRAFRRPVTPDEVSKYLRLYYLTRKGGDSFEEGICVALQGILVSPQFLYRIEQDPTGGSAAAHPVSLYELASRLSYFLWSSTPDEELLRAAEHGLLAKPEVLGAQVRRMLKDPKSQALVENFGGQWLELRKLESVKPDPKNFPQFDAYLRMSMRKETELFFQGIVREDRSILDFVDGKYSYLNERLAEFYGIPGVKGPEFRKVDLAGTHRGGIVTQASVLTVSSYATRTSPVLRGKWILSNLLNAPPPPPPPGVPGLEETKVPRGASLRQQLEAHRANPTCASCHARLDPLGFALENFNAIGEWRTHDGDSPVDTAGSLPDGRKFEGPEGLKKILLGDRDAFTRCLTEKLLTYALGRGLEYYDEPTVRTIAAHTAANDYRFSRLVLEIATSLPFRMRTPQKSTGVASK